MYKKNFKDAKRTEKRELTFDEKLDNFIKESKLKIKESGHKEHTKSDTRKNKQINAQRRKIALKKRREMYHQNKNNN